MNFKFASTLALAGLTVGVWAQDSDIVARIKAEGMDHSQIADTLSYLSDVIGPRLTASPAMKRANEWTRDRLTSWGLSNAHLEAWGKFGRGWQLNHFEAEVLAPVEIPLIAFPKAWSPSLRGTTTDVVLVDATDVQGLLKFKGKLKGKIVLAGLGRALEPHYTAQGSRYTEAELQEMADATPTTPRARRTRTAPGAPSAPGTATPAGAQGGAAARAQRGGGQAALATARLRFFLDEGVAAVIDQSRLDDGTIGVQQAAVPSATPVNFNPPPTVVATEPATAPVPMPAGVPAVATGTAQAPRPQVRRVSAWDESAPKNVPQVTVSAEQYNRLIRIIKAGFPVKMRLAIDAQFFNKDLNGYNTIAELPGSDLKDQLVMVGGHMDSWHSGTGATDNGAGVAVAMEAIRILKALNLQPRRTVRVALWSGEEEGLLGSRGYVQQHFGSFPNQPGFGAAANVDRGPLTKGPEYDKISAYYNLDNGTGAIRGIYLQNNPLVKDIFADWLKPFAELGAHTVTIRNTGSTDHVSFDGIGIPGFQFIQDTIEYDTRTHHTNQDVYDRIQVDDLKQAAIIMATFLYNTANRDELLPRKPLN